MAKEIERAMRAEHRTRSELVREALRVYLSARLIPAELPTPAEARAYRRGMAAYRRGDSITLQEYFDEWTVVLAGPARKSLKRIPASDKTRILAALAEIQQDPFQGDIRKLQGLPGFRRRVGNWRILFEVVPERRQVVVAAIERRTSTTY